MRHRDEFRWAALSRPSSQSLGDGDDAAATAEEDGGGRCITLLCLCVLCVIQVSLQLARVCNTSGFILSKELSLSDF